MLMSVNFLAKAREENKLLTTITGISIILNILQNGKDCFKYFTIIFPILLMIKLKLCEIKDLIQKLYTY